MGALLALIGVYIAGIGIIELYKRLFYTKDEQYEQEEAVKDAKIQEDRIIY